MDFRTSIDSCFAGPTLFLPVSGFGPAGYFENCYKWKCKHFVHIWCNVPCIIPHCRICIADFFLSHSFWLLENMLPLSYIKEMNNSYPNGNGHAINSQAQQKLLGFNWDRFWHDFPDIKHSHTQKFYWSYSSFISKCLRTGKFHSIWIHKCKIMPGRYVIYNLIVTGNHYYFTCFHSHLKIINSHLRMTYSPKICAIIDSHLRMTYSH